MRSRKYKLKRWTMFDVVIMVLATFVCFVTLYPMLYVVACSISEPLRVLAGDVKLWPVGFSTKAYEIVCLNADFWKSMLNTVLYVVAGCLLMFFTTVVMSYPLTRPNLKFRKFVVFFLLIPMYFGGGMIPSFLVITKLGLYNTIWALILPGAVNIGHIILCRTYMASLSNELIDSALIDGCNHFRTLSSIVVPLSKPVIAVIMIYTIVGVWNSWFSAAIYTTKESLQPLQLYMKKALSATQGLASSKDFLKGLPVEELKRFQELAMAADQIKYAMIVLSTVPIIAVYPMFQKYFTKGIMVGSLKG